MSDRAAPEPSHLPAEPGGASPGCPIVQLSFDKRSHGWQALSDTIPIAVAETLAKELRRAGVWGLKRSLTKFEAEHGPPRPVIALSPAMTQRLTVPPAINVQFEPLLLDEGDPTVRQLLDAPSAEAAAPRGHFRPFSIFRRVGVRYGLLAMFPFLFQLPNLLIQARRHWWVACITLGSILLTLVIVALVNRPMQWFVVPGGVIVRRGRGLRGPSVLRRYTAADASLVLIGMPRIYGGGWKVTLGAARGSPARLMTPLEAGVLLAAWRSPLPAPSVESVSDLA